MIKIQRTAYQYLAQQLHKATVSTAAAADRDPFPNGLNEKIVVYGRVTTRVEKVLYMLEELQLPFERVELPSPPPSYYKRKVNPLGLVPSIRDGAATLEGSNAICAYLAHKHGGALGCFPEDSAEVGRALQWGDFVENYLATPRLNVVYHGFINKQFPPSFKREGCPSPEEMEGHIDATVQALSILERHLTSAGRPHDKNQCGSSSSFIATPDSFTFADAIAAPWLHRWHQHAVTGDFGTKLRPENFDGVMRYYNMLALRPAFQRVLL
jgi:glutathione S-transferase